MVGLYSATPAFRPAKKTPISRPASAVPHLRRTAAIRVLEPPVALPGITQRQWWHPRHTASPAHTRVRERIAEIAAELDQADTACSASSP